MQTLVIYQHNSQQNTDCILSPSDSRSVLKFRNFESNDHSENEKLATIGRLVLCSIISDLVILESHSGLIDGMLLSMMIANSGTTKNSCVAIETAAESVLLIKNKTAAQIPKWVDKHEKKLFRKKIKFTRKNDLYRKAVKIYIAKFFNYNDPVMKTLYLAQPRVRKVIDSLM